MHDATCYGSVTVPEIWMSNRYLERVFVCLKTHLRFLRVNASMAVQALSCEHDVSNALHDS